MSVSSCTHEKGFHPPGFCPNRNSVDERVSKSFSSSASMLPPPGFSGRSSSSSAIFYPKQAENKSPEALAEMLLQTKGKRIPAQKESREICHQIGDKRKGLDQIVSLIQDVNITDSHYILNAILSKKFPNNSDQKYIQRFQKALFDKMPEYLLDVSILNQRMQLAGSWEDFKLVDELFDKIRNKGIADSYTYSIYLKYGDCSPQKALEIFKEASEKGLTNIFVLNNCLNILKDFSKYYPDVDRIFFSAMANRKDVQPQTCCIFLQAVKKTNLFEEADKAFELAKKRDLVNDYVIAEYIKICDKHGKWEEASKALLLLTTVETIPYTNYMLMAARCGKLDEAKKTFEILKRCGKATAFTHVKFLEILRDQGTFKEVEQFFIETQESRKFISNEFIQIYYKFVQQNQKLEIDQEIVDRLPHDFMSQVASVRIETEEGEVDPKDTYASWCAAHVLGHANPTLDQRTIYLLGKKGHLDLAKQVFDDAKAMGRINSDTCCSFLSVLKLYEAWELADEVFSWIRTQIELPQGKCLNIYADILVIQKRREDLEKLRYVAVYSDPKQEDRFFQVYIKHICNFGDLAKAEELIASRPAPILTLHSDMPELDLHCHSRWGGYFTLLRLMKEEGCPSSFHVICGQGGDEWGNYLVFKKFLLDQFATSPLAAMWSLREHRNNPGVLICEKKPS